MTPVVRGCIAIADQWLEAALFGQLGKAVLAALALAVTIMMALRYAEPIGDGDLFWHMAYARQMIEHGSLKLDHTLYSWTPASNAMIYCAWLSELVLYGLWQFTGPAGIFALRYAIVASVLFLIWRFARQHNVAKTPVLFLCLVLAVELIANGVLPKPEMLSLLAFTATVFVYATFRTASDLARAAVWLYFIPAILLIWVNSHGGFMLISLFLAAIAAGEIGLYGLGADERLPIRALWHLLAAWVLCAVAILLTPYGIKYPVALFREYVLGSVARPDARWNTAYRSIFDPSVGNSYCAELAGIAAALAMLITTAWRRCGTRVLRWLPLALAALAYVPLYAAFLRSTQFLPILSAFLMLGLSGLITTGRDNPRAGRRPISWAKSVGALVTGGLALAATTHVWLNPPRSGWHGFGIDNSNPIVEAEFLSRQKLGPNIYNVFDSGGYLLWRLYPQYRVMTDSRSFPYLSWFEDQYAFTTGSAFESFLEKYPAEVAVIDLAKQEMWRNFSRTKDWRLAFFGPTAAIFVRQERFSELVRMPADDDPMRFAQLNSDGAALNVFEFATFYGDYATANVALERLQTTLRARTPPAELKKAEDYRAAIHAIRDEKYSEAFEKLERGLWARQVSDRDRLVLTLLVSLARTPEQLDETARNQVVDALKRIVPRGM